jgi:2-methylisocitrate lyase-like PEP mutase family enzyme
MMPNDPEEANEHISRFGGPANVARTVRQYISAGVAGMHIEDQVQTKRCGHLMGKQVVSREEFLTRIRAAVIARDSLPGGSDFVSQNSKKSKFVCLCNTQVIIGRTDSAQVLGMEEAVARLKLAADAGADVCFIEGVKTEELLRDTVAALDPKPVSARVFRPSPKINIGTSGPRQRYLWWPHALFHLSTG